MSYFPLRSALLINPTESHHAEMQSREALAAGHTLDSISVLNARTERDVDGFLNT